MARGYPGGKGHPSRDPLSACRDFSSCSPPHWGELPTPHCLCTEPGFGAWSKASPFPQPTIYSPTPGQAFNSAIFPHLPCCFSSISQPQCPRADSSTGHCPFASISCHQSLLHPWSAAGAWPGLKGEQRRAQGAPYPCSWGGSGRGAPVEQRGQECGAVGGTVGSAPQRKGSLKQGRASAVPGVAGGRRHAQQPALCHRRRANVLPPVPVVCSAAPLAAQHFGAFSCSPLLQVVLQTPSRPCLWLPAGWFQD